ncbi:restriction endonuclease subunit S [Rhizobacter fulvus]
MSLPRYGEYKDSGERWLGAVPAHWQVPRLKNLFEIRKRIVGEDGHQVLSITQRGIKVKDIESNDGQLSLDYSKYQIVRLGDFAMNHMDLLTGFVDISPHAGVTSPDYRVFTVRDGVACEPRYFLYLLQNGYRQKVFYAFGQGASEFGRWRFSTDQFNDFRFPCPSPSEQATIAAFLDRETGKIDALIAEQEKLIALLAEKRQATISHAVTRGLNPDALMKDSGVTWLGELPAHWERVQLGRLCTQVSDGPHFSPSYVEDGVMFISARNVRTDGWSLEDAKYVSEDDYKEFCRRVIPEIGDVLYTKGGTTGIARVVDIKERFQVWVHVAVLKLNRAVTLPHYVAHALNSLGCYEQSQLYTRGATNQDLGLTRMVKIFLGLPPIEEQADIVNYLDSEIAKLDKLSAEAERVVALLKERRSALIAAAVTGQIDVRQA